VALVFPLPRSFPNSTSPNTSIIHTNLAPPDLHEYLGGPNFAPTSPHQVTGVTIPITFGHEFSSTVISVSAGVTNLKSGQYVSIQPTIYDGTCAACSDGLENACYHGGFVGLSSWGGSLSDAVVLPLPSTSPLTFSPSPNPSRKLARYPTISSPSTPAS
jgi:threonine dehydrogenase-like Zn-dependent dehydrogenase